MAGGAELEGIICGADSKFAVEMSAIACYQKGECLCISSHRSVQKVAIDLIFEGLLNFSLDIKAKILSLNTLVSIFRNNHPMIIIKLKETKMTKADLVKKVAEETGYIRKDVALMVDAFLQAVKDTLAEGHHIEIRGFGTFKLKTRKARMGRNPKTDEKVPVPPRTVPTFKFSRDIKDLVMDIPVEE